MMITRSDKNHQRKTGCQGGQLAHQQMQAGNRSNHKLAVCGKVIRSPFPFLEQGS